MLETKDVTKSFRSGDGTVTAVKGVTMTVTNGEFVAIVGRSGSGKTTLMNLLGAPEQPTSGVIEVDGQDITRLSRGRARPLPGAEDRLRLPELQPRPEPDRHRERHAPDGVHRRRKGRAQGAGAKAAGSGRADRRQAGAQAEPLERRRAATGLIARALANKPSVILADEPAGNLDIQTSATIVEILRNLSRSEGTTVILVTHDASIADQADRVLRRRQVTRPR